MSATNQSGNGAAPGDSDLGDTRAARFDLNLYLRSGRPADDPGPGSAPAAGAAGEPADARLWPAAPAGRAAAPAPFLDGADSPGASASGAGSSGAGSAGAARWPRRPAEPEDIGPDNRTATAALIAGLVGIAVLPGIVLGILGLRRARVVGTGRLAALSGIGLSLLWAAAIGLVVAAAASGQAPPAAASCRLYRTRAQPAVGTALRALSAGVPGARVAPDLSRAAGAANSAAASAQDITVRDDLAQLTGALEAALAEATARERVSALTRAALTSAAAATARLCP